MKLVSPKLRNEDWITEACAAHLAKCSVAEIRKCVRENELSSKVTLIGHKRFDLVSRAEIVEHFHLEPASCVPA